MNMFCKSFYSAVMVLMLSGCMHAPSYICEFTPEQCVLNGAKADELFGRVSALASRYGMVLHVYKDGWYLYRKDHEAQVSPELQGVPGSYGHAVYISYKTANYGSGIFQAYETKPSEFTLKIKAELEAIYRDIFGEGGFEVKEGIRGKAWGA